jgi:hypothetical protein
MMLDTDDRTHLDLSVTDPAEQQAEAERLISLGARRVAWDYARAERAREVGVVIWRAPAAVSAAGWLRRAR